MLLIAIVFILGALGALSAALGLVALPSGTVQKRVRNLATTEEKAPVARRTIRETNASWLQRLTPAGMLAKIEHNMVLAGRPEGWSRERVIMAKPVGAVIGFFFALIIISKTDSSLLKLLALGVVALGYFVPDLLIYNQATKRQDQIQKVLPDTLDQIVISIEAGVGFEAALARAGEKGDGPLAEEIIRLGQDMALGMSRREAYLGLADRTSVEELRNFARAIVQAEQYGVSIASVVRTQAKEMRIARRSRAEARAQQVPVKILMPLMSLILPVLFIIVLGPSVVHAYAIN